MASAGIGIGDDTGIIPWILSILPNLEKSPNLLLGSIGAFALYTHYLNFKFSTTDAKLKKYEEEFCRFEQHMEYLMTDHKLPKPLKERLRSFLVESRMIFEGKK